jgi:hypothetical protein
MYNPKSGSLFLRSLLVTDLSLSLFLLRSALSPLFLDQPSHLKDSMGIDKQAIDKRNHNPCPLVAGIQIAEAFEQFGMPPSQSSSCWWNRIISL